jgi:hypothetical protein
VRFTVIVMQMNGDVTDRRQHTWAKLQGNDVTCQLTQGFGLLLDEQVPTIIEHVVRFRTRLPDGNHELNWQQPNSTCALCTFFAAGEPAVTCVFLSGYDPVCDRVAVEEWERVLASWRAGTEMRPGPGLNAIRDRPLLVCVPWPRIKQETEIRRFSAWSVCLAAAFFQRAAAASHDRPETKAADERRASHRGRASGQRPEPRSRWSAIARKAPVQCIGRGVDS